MHVVFVCSGNICRSPIAEKVFAAELERAGLAEGVRVTSAGTGGWHVGDPADERAAAVLRAAGYPSDHRARGPLPPAPGCIVRAWARDSRFGEARPASSP